MESRTISLSRLSPLRVIAVVVGAVLIAVIIGTRTVLAQEIRFRLPANDPNTNSDVIRSAGYSPDGRLLAVGYGRFVGMLQEPSKGQAVVWEPRTGERKTTIGARIDGVCSVAFSPDGRILAVAEFPGFIQLCDSDTGQVKRTIQAPAWIAGSSAWSHDGKWIAAGLWTGAKDGVSPPGNDVVIWDVASGELVRSLKGHTGEVQAVAFSPDGKFLVSGGDDGTARVWDTTRSESRATLQPLTFVARAKQKSPKLARRFGDQYPVSIDSVAFSPDGRSFATSASTVLEGRSFDEGLGEVSVWNATTYREFVTLQGDEGVAHQVAFSPDGTLLVTARTNGSIRFWGTTMYRVVGETKERAPIAFSPNGREFVSSVDTNTLAIRKGGLSPAAPATQIPLKCGLCLKAAPHR